MTTRMYLVVLRYAMDDFPVLLTDACDEATRVAQTIGWDIPENVSRVLSIDAGVPCAICIYQFKDGQIVGARHIRSFEDEDDEDDEDGSEPMPVPSGDLAVV